MRNDDIAIRVSGLGKRYLAPQVHREHATRPPSLHTRLKEFFPTLLGAGGDDYFWAVRNVSFEVKRGEVLGVIGENGSGKSTLLKMLSGVTPPTEGRAEMRGRVGSLLEVGTGFHPDMTGRENIFFNGALLGVSVAFIRSRLDAIIDFSGIEEFIDVPVKRYSSGMYVRLAYAVTALLDSDILILDEVLAVGDAAFREKTEGSMREAIKSGKAVLFVSHNPKAVVSVCDRAIILHNGEMVFSGDAKESLAEYMSKSYLPDEEGNTQEPTGIAVAADGAGDSNSGEDGEAEDRPATEDGDAEHAHTGRHSHLKPYADIHATRRLLHQGRPKPTKVLKWISVHDLDGNPRVEFKTGEGMRFRIGFAGVRDPETAYFSVLLHNSVQDRMVTAHSTHGGRHLGVHEDGMVECVVPNIMLGDGIYSVMVDTGHYDFSANRMTSEDCVPYATSVRFKNGIFMGVGLDEFRGSGHASSWHVDDSL